jgi:hypothetical protein
VHRPMQCNVVLPHIDDLSQNAAQDSEALGLEHEQGLVHKSICIKARQWLLIHDYADICRSDLVREMVHDPTVRKNVRATRKERILAGTSRTC